MVGFVQEMWAFRVLRREVAPLSANPGQCSRGPLFPRYFVIIADAASDRPRQNFISYRSGVYILNAILSPTRSIALPSLSDSL